jgi:hypothetical protein
MPAGVIQAIDRFAGKFADLSRSQAIRALIDIGLHAGRRRNEVIDPKGHRLHVRKAPLAKRRCLASTKSQPPPPLLRIVGKE